MFDRATPTRCYATSPAVARRCVRDALEDWHDDLVIDQAELLVSEVATNALLHGRARRALVDVTRNSETVRISVRDRTHDRPVRTIKDDPMTPGGFGVVLLDEISSRWGVDDWALGKTVWFELSAARSNQN